MMDQDKDMFSEASKLLADYEAMPSGKVWSGISTRLDEKKNKRRGIIWFIFPIGASILLLAYYAKLNQELLFAEKATNQTERNLQNSVANYQNEYNESRDLENKQISELASNTKKQEIKIYSNAESVREGKIRDVLGFKTDDKFLKDNSQNSLKETNSLSGILNSNQGLLSVNNENFNLIRNDFPSLELIDLAQSETDLADLNNILFPITAKLLSLEVPKIRFVYSRDLSGGFMSMNRKAFNQSANSVIESTDTTLRSYGGYWGLGLKGGLQFGKHWSLQTGIGFRQYRFVHNASYYLPGTGLSALESINFVTGSGDFNFAPTTADYQSSNSLPINGKINHNLFYLQFPLEAGYSKSFKKSGLMINAGPMLHVKVLETAKFVSDEGIKRDAVPTGMAKLNVSMGLEAGYFYEVRPRVQLYGSLAYRYYLLKGSNQLNGISRPYELGIQFGIRRFF